MKWVIQTNLIRAGVDKLIAACKELKISYEEIHVIPFDETLPSIDTSEKTLFYGGTNFVTNIWRSGKWVPGVFFNENSFTFSSYLKYWKMLSSDAVITTFAAFSKLNLDPDSFIFIRPNKDLKEFSGEIVRVKDVRIWADKISIGNYLFDDSCEIAVSEPYAISNEWRLFVVNKKVVTGSHYRTYGRLEVTSELPESVIKFAEEQALKWSPADIYTLDIGECGDSLYVIEANCFNSSGFYAADVKRLVSEISDYVEKFRSAK